MVSYSRCLVCELVYLIREASGANSSTRANRISLRVTSCIRDWRWGGFAESSCVWDTIVVPIARRLLILLLFLSGVDAPMEDNGRDLVEWTGAHPSRSDAPASRGIRNAPLQCATMEVESGNVTVRAINGMDHHSNNSKGNNPFCESNPHPL